MVLEGARVSSRNRDRFKVATKAAARKSTRSPSSPARSSVTQSKKSPEPLRKSNIDRDRDRVQASKEIPKMVVDERSRASFSGGRGRGRGAYNMTTTRSTATTSRPSRWDNDGKVLPEGGERLERDVNMIETSKGFYFFLN